MSDLFGPIQDEIDQASSWIEGSLSDALDTLSNSVDDVDVDLVKQAAELLINYSYPKIGGYLLGVAEAIRIINDGAEDE